jgi:hypothetical protein
VNTIDGEFLVEGINMQLHKAGSPAGWPDNRDDDVKLPKPPQQPPDPKPEPGDELGDLVKPIKTAQQ